MWMVEADGRSSTSTRTGTTTAACRPGGFSGRGSSAPVHADVVEGMPSSVRGRDARRARALAADSVSNDETASPATWSTTPGRTSNSNSDYLGLIRVLVEVQDLKNADSTPAFKPTSPGAEDRGAQPSPAVWPRLQQHARHDHRRHRAGAAELVAPAPARRRAWPIWRRRAPRRPANSSNRSSRSGAGRRTTETHPQAAPGRRGVDPTASQRLLPRASSS